MSDESVDFTDAAHEKDFADEKSDNPVEPLTEGAPQVGANILTTDEAGSILVGPLEINRPHDRVIVDRSNVFIFNVAQKDWHQVWMYYRVNRALMNYFEEQWYEGVKWNHHPVSTASSGEGVYEAYWRFENTFSEKIYRYVYVSDQPVITYPAQNQVIADRKPRITGSGGEGCTLRVMKSFSAIQLSAVITPNSNYWAIDLNQRLPYGDYSIAVEQSKSGYTSRYSLNRTFKIRGIDFSSPQPAQLVPAKDIVFMGESNPGVMVHVVRADNNYKALSERVEVPSNQHWRVGLRKDLIETLESGSLSVKAQWHNGWSHDYSDILTFKVLGVPAITGPAIEQDMSFDVTGNNYLPGSIVDIYIDLSTGGAVGWSAVTQSGKTWSARVTLEPGTVPLVAEQRSPWTGLLSGKGVPRKFKIRPPN